MLLSIMITSSLKTNLLSVNVLCIMLILHNTIPNLSKFFLFHMFMGPTVPEQGQLNPGLKLNCLLRNFDH